MQWFLKISRPRTRSGFANFASSTTCDSPRRVLDFVVASRSGTGSRWLMIVTGVEAKILDSAGRLDIPPT
jgi:hypothetical protein